MTSCALADEKTQSVYDKLNTNSKGAGAGSKKNKKEPSIIIPESSESLITEESKDAVKKNLDKI